MATDITMLALLDEHVAILAELNTIEKTVKTMQTKSKQYQKKLKKVLLHYDKLVKKKKNKHINSDRIKSGINKESPISNELCRFLKISDGSLIARTMATTAINTYIKTNKLQQEDNKRKICLDENLANLFKLPVGQEITFFDLPKYMNHHFIKSSEPQKIE